MRGARTRGNGFKPARGGAGRMRRRALCACAVAAPPWRCRARSAPCCGSARCGSPRGPVPPPQGWTWLRTGEIGAGRGWVRVRSARCERCAVCAAGSGCAPCSTTPTSTTWRARSPTTSCGRSPATGTTRGAGEGGGARRGRAAGPRLRAAAPCFPAASH